MPHPVNNIAKLRKSRGLSQQDLAELVGTTNQHISHLEGGRRSLSGRWMVAIAEKLGVQPHQLLNSSAEETPPMPQMDFDLLRRSIAAALGLYDMNAFDAVKVARKALQIYQDESRRDEQARASDAP